MRRVFERLVYFASAPFPSPFEQKSFPKLIVVKAAA